MSLAVLLAQKHEVTAITTTERKAEKLNQFISPIQDEEIERFFKEVREGSRTLHLHTTTDKEAAYRDAELVIVATPTNYDDEHQFFDTSAVEDAIEWTLKVNPDVLMVIKSTIPVGYTDSVLKKYGVRSIIFSPEFLRESKALYDNLHPSRIVVGTYDDHRADAEMFADLLLEGARAEEQRAGLPEQNIPILIAHPTEAEAIKLFANTYLAVLERGTVGEVYNLGGHNEKTNIEIVKIILKELGKSEELITYVADRKGHDQRYAIDPTKAMRELGWAPTTMFADGIKLTIQWYKEHMDWMQECTSGDYTKYYEQMYGNR